jgi:hypothetical protein
VSAQYKKPSAVNWVSFLLLALIAVGVYGGWKFAPVYVNANKVDTILHDVAAQGSGLKQSGGADAEDRLRQQAVERIRALGITDQPGHPLLVDFLPGDAAITARYRVIVKHPFGKTTPLTSIARPRSSDGATLGFTAATPPTNIVGWR